VNGDFALLPLVVAGRGISSLDFETILAPTFVDCAEHKDMPDDYNGDPGSDQRDCDWFQHCRLPAD
jgi:hypothetical protein